MAEMGNADGEAVAYSARLERELEKLMFHAPHIKIERGKEQEYCLNREKHGEILRQFYNDAMAVDTKYDSLNRLFSAAARLFSVPGLFKAYQPQCVPEPHRSLCDT